MIGHEVDPLIRRLQQRDESALAELYDRAVRRAFGLAYHLLREGGAAEDVVQAAFATVWEQADRLDPSRGTAEAFLMTVTHRRAIDALRSTARRTAHVGDLAFDPPDGAEPVLEALTRTERAAEVREALEALPPAQRRVVQLAYFEGRTHHEIAALDGLPLGTVKSRMRLAIERLRGLLVAD